MKRGTEAKVKFKMLERALKMETWQVKGLLTSIWDFAATNAPAGNVGAYSNDEIAMGIGFAGDIEPIIAALVETKWLDPDERHRLVIHHWAEHCEDSIHVSLVRKRLLFSDGAVPKLTKLPKKERSSAQRDYKKLLEQTEPPRSAESGFEVKRSASHAYTCTMPIPEPKPLPKPAEQEKQVAGVFSKLAAEEIQDPAKLQAWYEHASTRRRPVIHASEQNRLMVFASAERAIEQATDGSPVGLFAWLVSGAHWDYLTKDHEDRAREKLRWLSRPPPAVRPSQPGFPIPEPKSPL